MKSKITSGAWPVLLSIGAMAAFAGKLAIELPPETAGLKPAPGAEIAAAQCLLCHSAEYLSTQPALPRAFWKSSVEKMQQKFGAPIPPEQVDPLVDYLVKQYGTEKATSKPGAAPGAVSPAGAGAPSKVRP
ncbi:MAG: cytochrome c [Verrucomicrobiota bacterium]|nr:cytochrome c [Verrucomicrobiota bacterium]